MRISGSEAIRLIAGIFFSPKGLDITKLSSHRLTYGFIRDEAQQNIDEVLVTVMRRPSTYTREDIVEINAHGGMVPLAEILKLLIRKGARLARPGEFTKRAFLNGRLDLCQAEAVALFIKARTTLQAKFARQQMEGGLSAEILKIKEEILDALAEVEAAIDFPEDDLRPDSPENRIKKLKSIQEKLEIFLIQAERGKRLAEGIKVVIAGRPNVGKSSLLNALLSRERAIVTPFPGTTRDTIEEEMEIGGRLIRLIDTAGWRRTDDPIEKEGVKKMEESVRQADLVIFMVDGSMGFTPEDLELFSSLNGQKAVLVINKVDLPVKLRPEELNPLLSAKPVVKISASRRINIEELVKIIVKLLEEGEIEPVACHLITGLRQEEIIRSTVASIKDALACLEGHQAPELISLELKEALAKLGEITGEVYTEDILEKIFSRFCIGK